MWRIGPAQGEDDEAVAEHEAQDDQLNSFNKKTSLLLAQKSKNQQNNTINLRKSLITVIKNVGKKYLLCL
jgi:Skp family chaperone for outer membrane proteins